MNSWKSFLPWLFVALWMAAIFAGSSRSTLPGPLGVSGPWNDALRTATHFGEYFVLAALTLRALLSRMPQNDSPAGLANASNRPSSPMSHAQALSNRSRAGVAAVAIAFAYAITDEAHQHFVPGRTCSLSDLAVDLAGALVFVLLASVIRRRV